PCAKYAGCAEGAGATALNHNGALKLNLWVFGGLDTLYRAIINKSTFAVVGMKKTNIVTSDDDALQATDKPSNNFLALEVTGHILEGVSVNAGGLPLTTPPWLMSPKAPRDNDEGTISADGLFATTNRNTPYVAVPPPDQLYVQKLTTTGRPDGD